MSKPIWWSTFVSVIAEELFARSQCPRAAIVECYEFADAIFRDFLADEGIFYGDPNYSWDAEAARALAREEVEFWEGVQ